MAVSLTKIKKCRIELERFMNALEACERKLGQVECYGWVGYSETGALRRASMDLSRALVELRK